MAKTGQAGEQAGKSKVCVDCGGNGVPHGLTYATIWIDEALASVFPPAEKPGLFKKVNARLEQFIGSPIILGLAAVGAAKKQRTPDDRTLLLAKCLWEEAAARGIEMWEWRLFGLPRNVLVAKLPNGKTITFEGIPAASYEYERVHWMDDKARLKKEFMQRGLPVARGGAARTEQQALDIFRSITPPVIVKPHSGSGSRHTVLHITTEEELIRGFRIAKQVSPQVVIEEELIGPVYRATVVNGKFQAALRRDPPSVVGDGTHTIAELVEVENKKPGRQGPYFSHVQLFDKDETGANALINEYAAQELEWQHLTPESIPSKGQRVYFHQKVNWSLGGTTADVTDETHPDNIELFECAAKELHAPITGIDFIIKDISQSWKEQNRSGILECNSMPFFDNHHLPFEGKPRNIAAAIWDMVGG